MPERVIYYHVVLLANRDYTVFHLRKLALSLSLRQQHALLIIRQIG